MSRDFFCILYEKRFDITILGLRTHNCKLDPAQRWSTLNPAYKKARPFGRAPVCMVFLKERRQQSKDYFTILAISSAKFSSRFSRPSPFSKRTNFTTSISPPSSFAVFAIYFEIVRSGSLTNC